MGISLVAQSILLGLSLASIYALMALGLTLMFGILGIVNLTHGVVYMLGAFGIYYIYHIMGLNFYLAMVATVISLGIVGLLMERTIYRPVGGKFAPFIVATLALMILMETVGNLAFGFESKGVPSPVGGTSSIWGITFTNYKLLTILVTMVLVSVLYYLIHRTKIGIRMRAVEEDKVAAALQGINVHQINSYVFILGFSLAAAAGALTAPLYTISPTMGELPLIKAFMVICLGGMGSIPGAILGAVVIGLADSLLAVTVGTELAYLFTWFVIIVLLVFRPKGLLGAY